MFLRCFSPAYHISWRGTTKTSGAAGGFGVLVGIGCRIEKAGGHSSPRLWGCIIPTLQQDPFLKQFCLEDMYSCSSDYLWYPYYPEYHDYCYQNVISRDNTGLSPADNSNWLGCIIASSGVNLNIRFDPDERLNYDLLFLFTKLFNLQNVVFQYTFPYHQYRPDCNQQSRYGTDIQRACGLGEIEKELRNIVTSRCLIVQKCNGNKYPCK